MSEIVDRIDYLLAQRNENRNNLQAVGIVQQTISGWAVSDRIPRADNLYKIAQYLNVSMEYLLTGDEKKLNGDEVEILYRIRKLNDEQKGIVLNLIDYLISINSHKKFSMSS